MSSEIKFYFNFNHPWSAQLWAQKIPREKWTEFYDKFGYEFGNWVPKETMAEAWAWIFSNTPQTEKVTPKAADD